MDILSHVPSGTSLDFWHLGGFGEQVKSFAWCDCPENISVSSQYSSMCIRRWFHCSYTLSVKKFLLRETALSILLFVKYPTYKVRTLRVLAGHLINQAQKDMSRIFAEKATPREKDLLQLLTSVTMFNSVGSNYPFMGPIFEDFSGESFLIIHDLQSRNQRCSPETEIAMFQLAKSIFFINENDRKFASSHGFSRGSKVLGISRDIYPYPMKKLEFSENSIPIIIFVASNAVENYLAIIKFIQEVFEKIRGSYPDFELHIFGGICDSFSFDETSAGVKLMGKFDKSFNVYAKAKYAVTFHSYVGGIKIKLVESMLAGVVPLYDETSADGLPLEAIELFGNGMSPETMVNYLLGFESNPRRFVEKLSKLNELCDISFDPREAYAPLLEYINQLSR